MLKFTPGGEFTTSSGEFDQAVVEFSRLGEDFIIDTILELAVQQKTPHQSGTLNQILYFLENK